MGKKRVLVGYGIDIDAVAGWLGSYKGEDSVHDISRGLFAGTIGVRRILKLLKDHNITATWFIPGHSLDTFPEECAMIRDAGHEIGLHGYSHENPTNLSLEQQKDILDHTYKQLTKFCNGKPPRGSVAPWWETSKEGAELLLSYGIEYDHSMSHEDCQAYWLRTGDTWEKIDYSKPASTWMKPLTKGQMTGLVEIPASWYVSFFSLLRNPIATWSQILVIVLPDWAWERLASSHRSAKGGEASTVRLTRAAKCSMSLSELHNATADDLNKGIWTTSHP